MLLTVDVLEVDVLVVDVLELDVLGARRIIWIATKIKVTNKTVNWKKN
jgi:hypothetical protein